MHVSNSSFVVAAFTPSGAASEDFDICLSRLANTFEVSFGMRRIPHAFYFPLIWSSSRWKGFEVELENLYRMVRWPWDVRD